MKISLLLNTFLVLFSTAIFAQAPQKICYQAAAKDAMGADMLSQAISIRASVVKGSPNGLPEWQETHSVVTDGFGLFTIDIGAGTFVNGTQTNFADIEWGNGTFWLRIEMDAAGGQNYILMGTSQMLSVPYSLYANGANRAATAETAENATNADFAINAGNAQTADTATIALTVAGDNDLDNSNEIQTLSYVNGELTLLAPDGTPTGLPVTIATSGGGLDEDSTNELQTLAFVNGELTILAPDGTPTGDPVTITTGGGGGLDEDPMNELQTLVLLNGELTILAPDGTPTGTPVQLTSNGGPIDDSNTNELQMLGVQNGELVLLNEDGTVNGNGVAFDENATNELQTLGYQNGVLTIINPDGMPVGDPIQLTPNGGEIDDSNTNEIQSLTSINGELGLIDPNGALTGNTVPFDASNTNELQTLGIQLGELVLLNADGTANGNGVEFDVSNTNEIQSLGIVNDTLILLNPDGTPSSSTGGGGIYFPQDNDTDPANELQELEYENGILSLTDGNEINIMSGSGFDAPGSSSDFPQGIAGEHIIKTDGTFTVPEGKVFWITAGNSSMELTNIGPAPFTIHPTTPNMPVFGEGVSIKDCMCTGMLVDTTGAITPIVLDFITELNTYQVPQGKVLFIKSGLKNDQPGRLRVNEMDMTFLNPSFTRGTRIMSFPEGTDIQAIPNPFGEIDLILTGYLLDRDSVTFDPNN